MRPPHFLWITLPGQPLVCPKGHVIRQEWDLTEDGFPRCTHHGKGGVECGARIYVLVLPRRQAGKPAFLCCDVTGTEIREVLEQALDVDQVLQALGITWSRQDAAAGRPPPKIVPPDQAA